MLTEEFKKWEEGRIGREIYKEGQRRRDFGWSRFCVLTVIDTALNSIHWAVNGSGDSMQAHSLAGVVSFWQTGCHPKSPVV